MPAAGAIAVEAEAGPAALRADAVPIGTEPETEPATPIPVDWPTDSAPGLVAIPIGIPGAARLDSDRAVLARKSQLSVLVQSPAVERVRSTRAQEIGDEGERLAAIRLEELGWRILARNLRVNRVEVDILAIDPSEPASLVLVEVRRRNRRDFGLAEETVDYRKRFALRRAAGELAIRPVLGDGRRLPELPVRVDLIAIDRGPDGRPSLRHHRGIDV
ncbi:MAG TPA: YraN family protein [Candidatus Limnocylindrales bacterium]